MSFPGGVISGNILPSNTGQDLGSASQRWDAYLQTLNVSDFGGAVYADQYSGADAGAKIAAAITALPSTGGIIDARGFGATSQTISSTISLGATSKSVVILFNPATKFAPSTSALDMFLLMPNAQVSGLTVDVTGVSGYSGSVIKLSGRVYDNQPGDSAGVWGHTSLSNVTIFGFGNTTGTGISLVAASGTSDFIQLCEFHDISISGMLYGVHAVASSNSWINGNTFVNLHVANAVHGVKLEAGATGSVVGNNFFGYQYEWGTNFSSNGLEGIWLAGTGSCRDNRFSGTEIWDVTVGGGRATVRIDAACGFNYLDGALHWAQASDASGTTSYIDTYTGISVATAGSSGGFRLAGSPVVTGDGTHTYVSPQLAATGDVYLQTSSATKNFIFDHSGNSTLPGALAVGGAVTGVTTLSIGGAKTTTDANGLVTKYNNVTTAGNGLSAVVAVTSQKAETAADTNVLTLTPPAAVGTYRVNFVLSLSAANTATLGWTMTWKDSNGNAQSPTNLALFQTGTAAPALTFTTSAAGNYHGSAVIDIDNSATAIVVKTTFSGTSFAGKASATIERIQ